VSRHSQQGSIANTPLIGLDIYRIPMVLSAIKTKECALRSPSPVQSFSVPEMNLRVSVSMVLKAANLVLLLLLHIYPIKLSVRISLDMEPCSGKPLFRVPRYTINYTSN